jgi:RNA 3'-terminal phosphate cyclase (ATP)
MMVVEVACRRGQEMQGQMLEIDGAYGEGGGQILRSSLTLAIVTGQPVRIVNIRANRSKPGLRPQHLTAVRAGAAVCDAEIEGDTLGSETLTFAPQHPAQAGQYLFDVNNASPGGSAGAVALILQTVLIPLALAAGPSEVRLLGGTAVPMSPPVIYLDRVYLPTLFEMGLRAKLTHRLWGFIQGGGGEVEVHIRGDNRLQGHDLSERGSLIRVEGLAFAAKLPSHIPQRMTNRARALLNEAGIENRIIPEHVPSPGLGTGLFLVALYEDAQAGFLSLGRRGLSSEEVAEIGCRALMEHHRTGAACDPYLADQLVIPFVLAAGECRATISRVTRHLLTNVWVVRQFGFDGVAIEGEVGEPGVLLVKGAGHYGDSTRNVIAGGA